MTFGPLDRHAIEQMIPHRDPFLLIDEITEAGAGVRGGPLPRAQDAWYLRGHFPGNPIMPGVLQVESLAQVGAVCGLSHPDFAGKLALFAGIDGIRFKRIVRPGDVLDLTCEDQPPAGAVGRAEASASVAGELACRGNHHLRADGGPGALIAVACKPGWKGARRGVARARADQAQRRDRNHGRDVRRVDRVAHGDPRAADRRRGRVVRRSGRRGGRLALADAGIRPIRST